ncbi:MAG: DUF924 family protein [Dokdonella sp.]
MRADAGIPDDPRCSELLDFWLGTSASDADVILQRGSLWFGGGADVDASIRARFGELREAAITGLLDDWLAFARGRLALVILVDQFSRNLFRADAHAFAHDGIALAWCKQGLDAGTDRALRPIERVFFYLPLEHSEVLADQQRSVALFRALPGEGGAGVHAAFANFLDYAQRHRDIIARFGRFPHRNAVLGRPSTTQEIAFLGQSGSSF